MYSGKRFAPLEEKMDYTDIYGSLSEACGSAKSSKTRIAKMRKALQGMGKAHSPVGDGNNKTQCAGTSRPAPLSCPSDCPLLEECFGQKGRQALVNKRASGEAEAGILAAMVASLAAPGKPVRLHVAGDFGDGGSVDWDYVSGIIEVAKLSESRFWSYTQFHDEQMVGALRAGGVSVLKSSKTYGKPSEGADCFVAKTEEDIKAAGGFACPQQTGKVKSCAECKLCLLLGDGRKHKPLGFIEH